MDQTSLEFTKQLGLQKAECARLESEIKRIATEITRHREYTQLAADRHMRKAALRDVLNRFAKLRHAMEKHKTTLEPMVRGEPLAEFGRQLSYYGLAAITGSSFGDTQSMYRPGAVTATDMERHTAPHRAQIADNIGLDALAGHLAAIELPLYKMLGLESTGRGGRPQNLYRNYVIQQLGLLYQQLFGKEPRITAGGEFWDLCSKTLQALGIEEGDLKSAIPRALKAAGFESKA
jgi:hypothetical protein